jgi:hypothetical protein
MGYRVYARDCDGYGDVLWLPTYDTYEDAYEQGRAVFENNSEITYMDVWEVSR